MMKYAWASITMSTCNFGNWLIEDSLKKILDLPEPGIIFDSFLPMSDALIEEINETIDIVISPGCTTLQPGQNKAYESFDKLTVATPSFGGAVWNHGIRSRFQSYLNMLSPFPKYSSSYYPSSGYDIGQLEADELSIVACKHTGPVGCRDPFTCQLLEKKEISSQLIGCPTLLSSDPPTAWNPVESRSLLFSFSRNNILNQIYLVNKLSKLWEVSLIIHEPYEERFVKYLDIKKIIRYESADQYFDEYSKADAVLTGRLHGMLPSIRTGTPAVFFGDPADTRFSILSWLGVKIHRLDKRLLNIDSLEEIVSPDNRIFNKVNILRRRFKDYSEGYSINTRL